MPPPHSFFLSSYRVSNQPLPAPLVFFFFPGLRNHSLTPTFKRIPFGLSLLNQPPPLNPFSVFSSTPSPASLPSLPANRSHYHHLPKQPSLNLTPSAALFLPQPFTNSNGESAPEDPMVPATGSCKTETVFSLNSAATATPSLRSSI